MYGKLIATKTRLVDDLHRTQGRSCRRFRFYHSCRCGARQSIGLGEVDEFRDFEIEATEPVVGIAINGEMRA